MNRQTVAVAVGTLAVLVVGGLLLYAGPSDQGPRTHPSAAKGKKGAGDKAKKEKPEPSHADERLPEEKLVHDGEVAADRPAAPAGAPNVVLVVASTQRRDQWTVYGGMDGVTPFLSEKAREGVRFDDLLTVSVEPRAADVALVTGRYPHRVGAVELSERKNLGVVPDDVTTLAERFQAAGWYTVGSTAMHTLNVKSGAAQGFDWYRDAQPASIVQELRIDATLLVASTLEHVAARTEAEKARPLYLQVAFVESHKPFKVPPSESEPFEREGDTVAPYRATVRRVDDAVRKLTEGLAKQGVTAENTLFLVLGDHGEGLDLPPAHRKQHGFVLYRSSVQVPGVLWGKGIPAGKPIGGLASTLDVAPTLAVLAGLEGQEGWDGVSLAPAITGDAPTGRERAYADTHYEGANRASLWSSTAACQKDYGSEIAEPDGFKTACFDRVADPDFASPVPNDALATELDTLYHELEGAAAETGGQREARAEGKAEGKAKAKGKAKGKADAEAPEGGAPAPEGGG